MSDEEKVPKIQVSSAYPGEWHLIEIKGYEGALSLEVRRPVGNEQADDFHLRFTTHTHRFDAESTKGGNPAHTHEGIDNVVLTFSGPILCGRILSAVSRPLPVFLIPSLPSPLIGKRCGKTSLGEKSRSAAFLPGKGGVGFCSLGRMGFCQGNKGSL